jgi:tetratricopeptide (TPR) repeat protein
LKRSLAKALSAIIMASRIKFILLFCLFLQVDIVLSQSLPSKPNQIDQNGIKQGDWVYFYDDEWNTLENGTNAAFYRLIKYEDGMPAGQVVDYYLNGQMQMSIDSVINEEPLQYDGLLTEYSEEGNKVLIEYMHNGKTDTISTIIMFRQLIGTYQKEIPGHLDLAYTANNLAYLYREQQQYDSAEIYYKLAKDIREKELGINDVIYANSCNKLGYVLMKQGKLTQAEPMYMTSKRVHGKILGKESDYYKNSRGNLAYIYMETGRYSLAKTLYQEAVDMQMNTKGKEDESYRSYTYQLARVYTKLNDWENALNSYLESKNITDISKVNLLWFVELMDE